MDSLPFSRYSALATMRRDRDPLARVLSFAQGGCDFPPLPRVARQAEHIVHTVVFTPGYQFQAAKAGIGAQEDPPLLPPPPNRPDDAREFLPAPRAGVLVRRPQPLSEQMLSPLRFPRFCHSECCRTWSSCDAKGRRRTLLPIGSSHAKRHRHTAANANGRSERRRAS